MTEEATPKRKPGRPMKKAESAPFVGFTKALVQDTYFRMPAIWIDVCAEIDNLAELKVVQYVLRHTWGYQDYEGMKHITIDEFVNGRKRRDGSRIDSGTGLSESAVREGIERAIKHGFLLCVIDDSDKARIKKYYDDLEAGKASDRMADVIKHFEEQIDWCKKWIKFLEEA